MGPCALNKIEVAELPSADALVKNAKAGVTWMPDTKSRAAANFDVGLLFHNRAHQTLDCILSFLNDDIQPFVVVLDQASAADQRAFLNDALAHQPNVRFITLTENIGVGPGRNRLSRECSSDWVLFVDNDTVLNTPHGVSLINSAIESAQDIDGYSPRILNVHENRFMDRLRIVEREGLLRFEAAGLEEPITNVFSGCATVMRRSLLLDEPYDERCFVGFEDFELALRAFSRRQPMRLRSLDNVTLAHKHMPVVSDPDVASTRMRYNPRHLARSFDVLKTQHHADLFSGWERWTRKQQEEMLAPRRIEPRPARDRMNLTFVVDAPGSASDSIVRELGRHLTATHVLTAVYIRTIDEPAEALRQIIESCPDVVHFMWRLDFGKYVGAAVVRECAALMQVSEAELLDMLCRSHITFSVSDYLFLDREEIDSLRPLYWLADGYCATSPRVFEIYGSILDYPQPSALIAGGAAGPARENKGQIADQSASCAALWRCFFEDVIRKAHPDAPNWRRFMIDKFFLSMDQP
jgi:hypothetical protein